MFKHTSPIFGYIILSVLRRCEEYIINIHSKLFITLICAFNSSIVIAGSALLEEAANLLSYKQPLKAMQLLESKMDKNAGLPTYDYLLGKSSLEAKKPNLAIFALERVSLTKPKFYKARFLLARAYYSVGELSQASREFNLILQNSQKQHLREASQNYLKSISDHNRSKNKSFNLALTFGIGTDSNVNNATDSITFKNLTLSKESRETSSSVDKTIISSGYKRKLTSQLNISTSTQLFDFNYRDATFVNTRGGALNLGLNHRSKNNARQFLSVGYQHILVDGVFNSRQLNSSISHYQKLTQRVGLQAIINGNQTDFNDLYQIKNARGINGGLKLFLSSKNNASVSSTISLISGLEKPLQTTSPYGYKFVSALATASFRNGRKASLINTISYSNRNYDKKFFSIDRTEKSLALSTKLVLKPTKNLTLSSQFRIMRTRSPIALYEYDKVQLMFLITRQLI